MSKHTPGPWTLNTVRTSSGLCHKVGPFPWKDGKQNYACIYDDYPGYGDGTPELIANSHIIAAAPDLLKALEELLTRAELELADPDDVHEVYIARIAIAKAKGEA